MRHAKLLPAIMFILVITANFPLDIHVPAMPIIAQQLNISVSYTQLTISLFLLGYSLFPIVYGCFSDAYGRRHIILIACFILMIGSLLCAMATTANQLLVGRFIQGSGTAGLMCLARSILRDGYQKKAMARITSLLGVGVELSLALSPAIGGYLVSHFNWHSNFLFSLILALVAAMIVFVIYKETNQYTNRSALQLSNIWQCCKTILSHHDFLRYLICTAAAFSSGMVFFTISPFLIQNQLHYSAKAFGLLSLIVTGSIVLGSIANAYCVKRFSIDQLTVFGLITLLCAGTILIILNFIYPLGLTMLLAPSALAFFAMAFLFGNCMSGALHPFPKQAGMASSLYSTIQIVTAFAITSLISAIPHNTDTSIALTYIITSAISLIIFLSVGGKRKIV